MPNELYFQRMICKLANKAGGVGAKWSNALSAVGKPDCIFSFLGTGAAFVEFKLIKVSKDTYKRKLNVTKLQRKSLADLVNAGSTAFIGVIVYRGVGKWRVYAYPPDATRACDDSSAPWVEYTGGKLDMEGLIYDYNQQQSS